MRAKAPMIIITDSLCVRRSAGKWIENVHNKYSDISSETFE